MEYKAPVSHPGSQEVVRDHAGLENDARPERVFTVSGQDWDDLVNSV